MFEYINDHKIFKYGLNNYEMSRIAAKNCINFKADHEYEQVDSELISCYNCIYRRWKSKTIECMKNASKLI
ncbi:hypothetical protein QUF55_02920 [Clostridiaceae bacterium HSG29]|nr:hypothetical protein [Clostridiaceae bacterium HSG29]